jgi:hypothetical protein
MTDRKNGLLRWNSERKLDPLRAAYLLDRLQRRCEVCPECGEKWDWQGNHSKQIVRAVLEINAIRYPVKTLAWAASTLRAKPVDRVLMSRCPQPSCINPKLATLATKADVVHKQVRDGVILNAHHRRQIMIGRRKRATKLDMDKARAIRASEKSVAELAIEHGVSKQTIRRVLSGAQWIDLDSPMAGVFTGLMAANDSARRRA